MTYPNGYPPQPQNPYGQQHQAAPAPTPRMPDQVIDPVHGTYSPHQAHPGHQPQAAAPQQAMMPAAGVDPASVQIHGYDPAALQQQQQAMMQRKAGASGDRWSKYYKFPNVDGKGWNDAKVGDRNSWLTWLMPSWTAGAMPFVEEVNHQFVTRSFPGKPKGGLRVLCTASQGHCWVCESRKLAWATANEALINIAKEQSKKRTQYLWQVLLMEKWELHDDNGTPRPLIVRFPSGMQEQLLEVMKLHNHTELFHPQYGRPFHFSRSKTGASNFDVKWNMQKMDPQPLHPWFAAAFNNMHDLSKELRPAKLMDIYTALHESGLPIPQGLPEAASQEQAQYQQAQHAQLAQPAAPGMGPQAMPAAQAQAYAAGAPAPMPQHIPQPAAAPVAPQQPAAYPPQPAPVYPQQQPAAAPGTLQHLHNQMG